MPIPALPIIAILIIIFAYHAFKVLQEYERGVDLFPRPLPDGKGSGPDHSDPVPAEDEQGGSARHRHGRADAGRNLAGQRFGARSTRLFTFRIVDPEKAIIRVADVFEATSQLRRRHLRSVLGQHELDDMLAERDKLNDDIQGNPRQRTDNWGIKVANVEIKHVDLDESMIRAIAQQAEAERARRAKVINAEGEKQAAQNLPTPPA